MPPLPADSIHARACKLKCEKILTRPRKTSFMVSAYFVFDSFSCDTFNLGCKKAGDLFGSPA